MSDDGEDNTTSPEQRASGRARPSLAGKAGRSAACGYHAPGRSAGKAARLMVMSCGGGEGGRPTCQLPATRGLVEEPVAAHAAGNAVADRRSLPAGLGKTQRPVDRGAGGNRCQSALPCGTRRLLPTRPGALLDESDPRGWTRAAAPSVRVARQRCSDHRPSWCLLHADCGNQTTSSAPRWPTPFRARPTRRPLHHFYRYDRGHPPGSSRGARKNPRVSVPSTPPSAFVTHSEPHTAERLRERLGGSARLTLFGIGTVRGRLWDSGARSGLSGSRKRACTLAGQARHSPTDETSPRPYASEKAAHNERMRGSERRLHRPWAPHGVVLPGGIASFELALIFQRRGQAVKSMGQQT
jgi:hypothetical protein